MHPETLKSFPIQVKASSRGALVHSSIDKWCNHSIDEDNRQAIGKLKPLKHPNLVWILVRLSESGVSGARFFVCTEGDIQKKIVARYSAFMERHNYRRPGGGASQQAILNIKDVAALSGCWRLCIAVVARRATLDCALSSKAWDQGVRGSRGQSP